MGQLWSKGGAVGQIGYKCGTVDLIGSKCGTLRQIGYKRGTVGHLGSKIGTVGRIWSKSGTVGRIECEVEAVGQIGSKNGTVGQILSKSGTLGNIASKSGTARLSPSLLPLTAQQQQPTTENQAALGLATYAMLSWFGEFPLTSVIKGRTQKMQPLKLSDSFHGCPFVKLKCDLRLQPCSQCMLWRSCIPTTE